MQAPEETNVSTQRPNTPHTQRRGWFLTLVVIGIAVSLSTILWFTLGNKSSPEETSDKEEASGKTPSSVELNNNQADIKVITVSQKPPSSKLRVAGSVEANEQQVQQISALAAGRVEVVNVILGDQVRKGMLLLKIESPQVAEMHGKLHEAETKLTLSQVNLERVKQAANKVAVLKAKAALDESESTLKRTKQLVSEGLTAGKDLIAAQSDFEKSKAEYNFQKDISLNREVAEAVANLKTSETEAIHLRDSLKVLNAQMPSHGEGKEHDISTLELRSPISGVVLERLVNPGAGVEAGKPLLTIANTSTLWVIANVPEKELPRIRLGMPAEVLLEGRTISGSVSYIDPRLNEDTRTARVRVVVENAGNKIHVGSFAQVELQNPLPSTDSTVFVPASSVQTIENKKVVFVKTAEGAFSVREVRSGEEVEEMIPIFEGLKAGERIASNGSFVLKSKLLKNQMGDED